MKKVFCRSCLALAAIGAAALPSVAETVDASLFPHSVTIQFDGCTATTPLENFPVPVKLSTIRPVGFSYADCAVDSFRFTDIDGNVLAHDVESWNQDGTSVVWVSMPSLSRGSSIFLRYGAAAESLPANNASDVWTRAGYVGVWHMNETTGNVPDAAGNSLTATPSGKATSVNGTAGLIGGARGVIAGTGEKGWLSVPNYDSLALGSDFTISAWVKMTNGNGYGRIFSRKSSHLDANGWEIEMNSGSKTAFTARAAANNKNVTGSFPDLTTDWHLVQLAYSDSTLEIYANGSLVKSGAIDPTNIDNGKSLSIGNNSAGNEASFYGLYDEVRLRRGSSSLQWQQMEVESARKEDFAAYSPVDQDFGNVIAATAGTGGLVRLGSGDAAASVMTESVEFGTVATAEITAVPDAGYRFFRWVGNGSDITAGSPYSTTITVTTKIGTSLAAEFVSLTGNRCITIVNGFDHPSGGLMSSGVASVPGSVFSNKTDCVIQFTHPDDAPEGLREYYNGSVADWAKPGFSTDWGFFTAIVPGQSAQTQSGVRCAHESVSLGYSQGNYSYSGSWYVPTDATYSFRMHMNGKGQLVIDNKIILQQKSNGTAVTTNDVALTAGWHNLHVVFVPLSSTIGPKDPAVCGILYSAENADLKTDPSLGHPFAAESGENAHRFSTAYSGAFIPSMWADGGDMIVDCSNIVGTMRIAGHWGSLNHSFAIANVPDGCSLELGRTLAYTENGFQNLDGFAWIDWTRTDIYPATTPITLLGGVALKQRIPEKYTWTYGPHVTLATDIADYFGVVASDAEEFHLPEGFVGLLATSPTVLGDKVTIHCAKGQAFSFSGAPIGLTNGKGLPFRMGATKYVYKNNIELAEGSSLAGSDVWNDQSEWSGYVRGNGRVGMTGWGRRMNITGEINVKGSSACGQLGNCLNVRPVAGTPPCYLGTLTISSEANNDYTNPMLFYCPQGEGESALTVGTVSSSGAKLYPENPNHVRGGAALTTCSNNTICVNLLKGNGIHLRAAIPGGANSRLDTTDGMHGFGNMIFGTIDMANTLYVSSNVNITVTNVAKAATFDYSVQSGGVNDAVLDIEGECTPSTLKATDVAMLPARVKGFVGNVTLTETAAKTYPTVIDFDKPAPVHGGCDGSGTLTAAPAGGAFEVTFAGEPVAGDYGLARFTSGGELLAGWTAVAPKNYKNHSIAVIKDSTGIWLSIRKGGFVVIVR